MGVQKLDIEFEDEEELEAKKEAKAAALPVEDMDLSFDVEERSGGAPKKEAPAKPKAKASEGEKSPVDLGEERQKRRPESEAQPQQQQPVQQAQPAQQPVQQAQQFTPRSNYQLGDELNQALAQNPVLAIEMEARIKVEVTKKLAKLKAKTHGKNVILNEKVKKILGAMSKKAPALKNELMMIKKLIEENASLDDFDDFDE